MLRYPDVSADRIVFSYANDLWIVSRKGGEAQPLSSPAGQEVFPRFSPDGRTIVFQGNYEGNRDLYTLSPEGGVPFRVTHNPAAETPCGWTPDGRLIFSSNGQSGLGRAPKLFTVSAAGGLPEALPVPYGTNGAISPDGRWLAYTPYSRDARTWKRYRGGMASDVWLFNLKDHTSRRITNWEGTDSLPMWQDRTLYYLSDQGPAHRLNIWKYELSNGTRGQVTHFTEFDVKWPAIGPGPRGKGEIVFQLGPDLRLLDLGTENSRVVEVTVPGDRPFLRPRTVDASKTIQSWGISATGKRAVVQARGDVWTLPAKNGSPRNLTHSNGVSDRAPAWSPDGRWIAWFSDETGEYELYLTQSDGKGETRQVTHTNGPFKTGIFWSPDSKKIAFSDKAGSLSLLDVDSGEVKLINKKIWAFVGGQVSAPSWSHDSRWITFASGVEEAPRTAVWIYNVETGEKKRATSGRFNESGPVFDRKGDYLFYVETLHLNPTYSDLDSSFIYRGSQVLMAVPLRADMKSPWAPKSDEETWDKKKGEKEEKENGEEAGAKKKPAPSESAADDGLSGTWEGSLSGDMLPPGGASMSLDLVLEEGGAISGSVSTDMGGGTIRGTFDKASGSITATIVTDDGQEIPVTATVHGDSMTGSGTIEAVGLEFTFELKRTSKGGGQKEEGGKKGGKKGKAPKKVEIAFEGFEHRALTLPVPPGDFGRLAVNDKNQLLYVRVPAPGSGSPAIKLFDMKDEKKQEKQVAGGGNFDISADGKKLLVVRGGSASIRNAAPGGSSQAVSTRGMSVRIDPMTEWKELFTDAWRIERDYFYDPNMHGVDWKKIHDRYMAMVENCASREDLAFVMGEMISELNVGHAYVMSAGDTEKQPSVSTGLLGADYELDHGAYRISRIYEGAPWDADSRGPLSRPGVDVKVGDYLLAVNGVPVDASQDPWAAFQGLGGRVITLTVSSKPVQDEEAREVVVKTLSNESGLRYRAWVEHNRAYVEKKTGGRLGYIHVPDTGQRGQNELFRQFYSQIGKEGLIIDERWNGGGQIPTRFIELLNRPVTNYWAGRDGEKDWQWPPDSHQGPKCMLINGLAGSGGDAFPNYFRWNHLGKLIGMRTWGGLVGISGNPALIDGGYLSAPTFAFYKTNGHWGIEGHGVDPDIEVVDDPALMVDGGDPQLDAAIQEVLTECDQHPFQRPKRPAYPDKSGMGIVETDK